MQAPSRYLKDPISSATHFGGFLAALVGLWILSAASFGDPGKFVVMFTYGLSLVLLFGASAAFHFFDLGPRGNPWLRRLDHAAIFLLIGGSYLPPLVHLLDGAWRLWMLSVVAALTLVGVVFRLVWLDCPAWLSTAAYLTLGWVVVIPGPILLPQIPAGPLAMLVGGGVAYTLGAAVYLFHWPDPVPDRFGFHEVWHLFVLAGAAGHFLFTWWLLGVPVP